MNKTQWIMTGSILAVCLACMGYWVYTMVTHIDYPQLEYSEGLMMYVADLFGSGRWDWELGQVPPFMVSFYPGLIHLILGQITNIFGDSLIVGRLVVITSTVACLVMIYLIVWRITGSRLVALIGALLPLTHPIVQFWSMIVRADITAVMFELIGLYLIVHYRKGHGLLLSIPFFLLAIFTKQSIVGGALAVCIWMILKYHKQGLIYTGLLGGAGLAIFGIMTLVTGGEFFNHVILYQQTVPTLKRFADDFALAGYAPLIPALLLAVFWSMKNPKSLLAIYFMVSFVLATVTMFRLGSSTVYFIEVIMAASLAGVLMLHEMVRVRFAPVLVVFAIPVIFLAALIANPHQDTGYKAVYAQARDIIADADYPIPTENVQLVLDAGKEPYHDPFVFTQLARKGYWDEGLLLDDLRANRVKYVVTEAEFPRTENKPRRFSPAVEQAVIDNYHIVLDSEDYGLVVYKANKNKGG